MITITARQMAMFSEAARRKFEADMTARARRLFPDAAAKTGTNLPETITDAIRRANSFGLTASRDIALYIDLVLVFGSNFDTVDTHSWAADILADPFILDPTLRIETLHDAAQRHLARQEADEA